jgi:hypothetical protein
MPTRFGSLNLGVGRFGEDLAVVIGVEGMTATTSTHSIGDTMSAFDVGDQTFMIDAHVEAAQLRFETL